MSLRFTLLPLRLLGLSCLTLPPAAAAQAPASDSAAPVAADSVRPPTDSASKPDSTPVSPDSTRPSGAAAAASTDTAVKSPEPADSTLLAACGPGGTASVARDLLVIVFAPGIGQYERTGAAKTVRGKLLGPVSGEPGAYYLRLPAGGGEFQLRTAADQLIRLSPVRQVGSRACPPPPPVKTRQTSP